MTAFVLITGGYIAFALPSFFLFYSLLAVPPFVGLLLRDKESAGVFNKVEDAGIVKPDGQKGIESCNDNGRHEFKLRQRKHRKQKTDANNADVSELP